MNKINMHRIPSNPLINQKTSSTAVNKPKQSFRNYLTQATQPEGLKISKHASERLKERGIQISEAEWTSVAEKLHEAKDKGVKDSLVLLEQAALIASAENKTIITAMNRAESKDQLFTNIDGTIVL